MIGKSCFETQYGKSEMLAKSIKKIPPLPARQATNLPLDQRTSLKNMQLRPRFNSHHLGDSYEPNKKGKQGLIKLGPLLFYQFKFCLFKDFVQISSYMRGFI